MVLVRTVYEQRCTSFIAVGVGILVSFVGAHVAGELGIDLGRGGLLLFVAALIRIDYQFSGDHVRAGYRSGRADRKRPVLVDFPRREDADR